MLITNVYSHTLTELSKKWGTQNLKKKINKCFKRENTASYESYKTALEK